MNLPGPDTLALWIKNKWNALLISEKGVGKSAIITEAFTKAYGEVGVDWLYFSAATLDPWVDFVGIPRPTTDPVTGVEYLELVRPKQFATGNIKAIFFDEYNRAPDKVLNATMELIQFKSINGHKFPQLEIIWAAINPEDPDKTYSVGKLDPAHKDRFVIQVEIDSKPDKAYFRNKYPNTFDAGLEWWAGIPAEIQKEVSPRRLDMALEVYENGGNIKHVLPASSNPTVLIDKLGVGPIKDELKKMAKTKDAEGARAKLAKPNFFAIAKEYIFNSEHFDFFVPLLPPENIASIVNESTLKKFDGLIKSGNVAIKDVLQSVYSSVSTSRKLKDSLQKALSNFPHTDGSKGSIKKDMIRSEIANWRTQMATEEEGYARTKIIFSLASLIKDSEATDIADSVDDLWSITDVFASRSQVKTINETEYLGKYIIPAMIAQKSETELKQLKTQYPEIFKKHLTLSGMNL